MNAKGACESPKPGLNYLALLLVHPIIVFLVIPCLVHPVFAESQPLVADVKQVIQAPHAVVTVEKVVAYPNKESLGTFGHGFSGKSVEMEYGRGPIVIFTIEKDPGYSRDLYQPWDWIQVELFSDGKKLNHVGRGGLSDEKTRVARFGFFVENEQDPMQESVELPELGHLKLKLTLFKVEKMFDLPFEDLPQGDVPVYEDQFVQITDAIWTERWDERRQRASTTLKVGFKNKNESASYDLIVKTKESRYPSKNTSGGRNHLTYRTGKPKSDLESAQFWGILPVVEKMMTVGQLRPQ